MFWTCSQKITLTARSNIRSKCDGTDRRRHRKRFVRVAHLSSASYLKVSAFYAGSQTTTSDHVTHSGQCGRLLCSACSVHFHFQVSFWIDILFFIRFSMHILRRRSIETIVFALNIRDLIHLLVSCWLVMCRTFSTLDHFSITSHSLIIHMITHTHTCSYVLHHNTCKIQFYIQVLRNI